MGEYPRDSLVSRLAWLLHNCSLIVLRVTPIVFLLACASAPASSSPSSQALEQAPRLVHSQRVWASPSGTDGVPRYTLAWEHPDGTRTSAGVGLATHATQWMGGALYVDPQQTLRYEGELIATDVIDAPAVSPDGSRFAYVVVEDDPSGTRAALHVSRGLRDDVVWDRSLLSLGALRFSPDGSAVFGVGSVNGGVAGLHVVDDTGARCLTNCELRVGEAWDDFVAPPGSASALSFDGDHVVVFDGPQGRIARVWR